MRIEQQTHGAVQVLKPVGPVTQAEADVLRERLETVRVRSLGRLVVDGSAMPFIDSRGLEALLDVNDRLAEGGAALKLCGLGEVVREALDLTDLASSFELFDDVGSAVRSFL